MCSTSAYPLAPEELRGFCAGKRAVLVVEEGYPDYVEQAVTVELRRADLNTRVFGKGPLPQTGEYTSDVVLQALAAFLREVRPENVVVEPIEAQARTVLAHKSAAAAAVADLPARPPAFCTGCPERPVFAAIKLAEREIGRTRHRLPFVCDHAAVQSRQLDPRLWDEPGEHSSGRPEPRASQHQRRDREAS